MDRGTHQVTAHGIAKRDMTEQYFCWLSRVERTKRQKDSLHAQLGAGNDSLEAWKDQRRKESYETQENRGYG